MTETIEDILAVGGKSNSLGRASEVLSATLKDNAKLEELYGCLFADDPWVRMRAVDTLEKVCRVHPTWIETYVDRIQADLSTSTQASIQWHIAQIYTQVDLNDEQKNHALRWLTDLLRTAEIDWIVSANAMKALDYFVQKGDYSKTDFELLLRVQRNHKSKAVIKRADKLLAH